MPMLVCYRASPSRTIAASVTTFPSLMARTCIRIYLMALARDYVLIYSNAGGPERHACVEKRIMVGERRHVDVLSTQTSAF